MKNNKNTKPTKETKDKKPEEKNTSTKYIYKGYSDIKIPEGWSMDGGW